MKMNRINSFQRYGHSKFSKMAASRHLGFGPTGSRSIQSADLENPTLEPNMKWIGSPVAEIWPFEVFQNARSVGRSSVLYCCHVHCSYVLLLYMCIYSARGVKITSSIRRRFSSRLSPEKGPLSKGRKLTNAKP